MIVPRPGSPNPPDRVIPDPVSPDPVSPDPVTANPGTPAPVLHLDSQPLTTIFAKDPRPGGVKTRLVPPLTFEQAARLAQAMLEDVLRRHAGTDGERTALALSPPQALETWAERLGPRVLVEPQVGENLGQRLAHWFERHLSRAPSVVVVAADCPLLRRATVQAAQRLLAADADLVLAPDSGGGYALVGLARPAPELFLEVPMSTPQNLERTLERARRSGLLVELLDEQRDVDEERDLVALLKDLRENTETAAHRDGDFPTATLAVLEELLSVDRA